VYHFAPDVFAIPEAAGYVKKFEAKYGTISGFGPPAYEAMNILLTAINKAAADGTISREEVLKNVAETKGYKGMLGFPSPLTKRRSRGRRHLLLQVVGKDFNRSR